MTTTDFKLSKRTLKGLARKYRFTELAMFGSAAQGRAEPDSDVDVLVSYEPGVRPRLHEFLDLKEELEALFQRDVDLVERRSVEQSPNYIRRRNVLEAATTLYAAAR
jgi:predicted nucleotidyltransferase